MKSVSSGLIKNYYNDGILDLYYFLFSIFFAINVVLSRLSISDFLAPLIGMSICLVLYVFIKKLSYLFNDRIKGIAIFKKKFKVIEVIIFAMITVPVLVSATIYAVKENVLEGERYIMLVVFSVVLFITSLLFTLRFRQFRFLYYSILLSTSFVVGKWLDHGFDTPYATPVMLFLAAFLIFTSSIIVVKGFLKRNSIDIKELMKNE